MIKHFRRWNIWRRNCTNNWIYKMFVLLRFVESPTMAFVVLPEEWEEIGERIKSEMQAWEMEVERFRKQLTENGFPLDDEDFGKGENT